MPFASYIIDLKSSTRTKDANGYLHVKLNNLTRGQVSPYLGREVSAKDDLGWDDEKVYNLLRDPEELRKATSSYNGLPILFGHHECAAEALPKDQIIGTTGTEAVFNGDFMQNSLTIWDASAVKAIEDGEIEELSCGYSYNLDPAKGEFNGASYDGVMRDIKPNHVALVEKGRAGSEVRVGDSAMDADKPGHAYHGNQFTGGVGGGIKKKAKRTTTIPVKDIAKRKEVSPKAGLREYGKVTFADTKNKKYPLDTRAHVRAALSYWGMSKNRSKYSKSDQSVIGGRIKAAAKRLGIGQTTGDSAGKMKETTMAKSAKKALSPLAHRVAGAVHAHLRSKLAADAAIDGAELLDMVKNASDAKFVKQINGIVGTVKEHYGLSNVDELRGLLLEIADDEMEEPDGDGYDGDDEDGEDEDDADPEEGKKAKPFGGKETPEEEKAEMEAMAKKAGDAAIEKMKAEFKALRQAERDVQPLVGEVSGLDTAEEVYRYTLKTMGVEAADVHPSALPCMVKMLREQPASRAADNAVAVDAAGTLERFPNLKNLKRIQ